MIEELRGFIITLCTAIFFITAVQMILPDNSLKKYCSFALGLLLVVIMLNPIVKLLNSQVDIYEEIDKSTAYIFDKEYEVDYDKYKKMNIENTLENFQKNFENQCVNDLEDKFKDKKFSADVQASFDEENTTFKIDSMQIALKNGMVDKIKKVDIGGDDSVTVDKFEDSDDEESKEIKKYLSEKYEISQDIIYVSKR
ncbi:stage III sporulation protein AF [Clostridium senegalense]|uniref:stage III sporulation protein AF n=1 Tax=Clostridium senegalense TaxID=1465809 RepID=UPI001C11C8DD|nr:stage III sporulation protein AF [Clostridium senegalense]MBU5225306.1 stage III sporulation protein AF [Clostridium senegalense]